MPAATIYKLLTRGEWEAAQAAGVYRGSAHDARDGFIHFSTAAQLAGTARKYFAGVPGLVLLAVDVEALKKPPSCPSPQGEKGRPNCPRPDSLSHPQADADTLEKQAHQGELARERAGVRGDILCWEPARDGDLFPHLYEDLPISAVRSIIAIPLGADGIPILPDRLQP